MNPTRVFRHLVPLGLVALALSGCGGRDGTPPTEVLSLHAGDRILVLAPHPDDETLGCAGVIARATRMGLPVHIAFLTNGDSNEWSFMVYRKHPVIRPKAVIAMGEVRHHEAIAAAAILGVPRDSLVFLGYPDFGTLRIWEAHWGDRPPLRGVLTRATSVPYSDALRPGAPHTGDNILRDLEAVIRKVRPTKIFVSHPADQNSDHQALYLFLRLALWNLDPKPRPAVYLYLVHYTGWPGNHTTLPLAPPRELAGAYDWLTFPLSIQEVDLEREALSQHRSQVEAKGRHLRNFVRSAELFARLPEGLETSVEPDSALVTYEKDTDGGPEDLEPGELADFVGFSRWRIGIVGSEVVVNAAFNHSFTGESAFEIVLAGWKADRPFASLPRPTIRVTRTSYTVSDPTRTIGAGDVAVERRQGRVLVRVPLAALGRPDRVICGGRTLLGSIPVDTVPWNVISVAAADRAP